MGERFLSLIRSRRIQAGGGKGLIVGISTREYTTTPAATTTDDIGRQL